MNKNIINEVSRIKKLMNVISEQVVTDYDSVWDYKKDGDNYFVKKKDSNSWIKLTGNNLESVKTKVFKDSSTQSTQTSSANVNVPFKNREEGDRFRKWVNDTHPEYAKQINLDPSGSYNNSYIKKAWGKYGGEYMKSINNEDEVKDHFVFYFSFPSYEPKYDSSSNGWFEDALDWARQNLSQKLSSGLLGQKGTYGPMGHAGVALINSSGIIDIYEFGRYEGASKGFGITIHKTVRGAEIMGGKITNLESVCSIVKNNAAGQAKQYNMKGVAIPITKEGYSTGKQYANSIKSKKYQIFDFTTGDKDANCATFGLEVVRVATGSGTEKCLPNPGAALLIAKTYRGSESTEC